MSSAPLYDFIGTTYAVTRRTEPRIAEQVWDALGDARTVLNVGAGTGSYEPSDRDVTAVEPSAVMRAQRPSGAARCMAATAERLPFPDQSFDAAMAFATVHHWHDPIAGLREMRRVARRVVVFTCDTTERSWRRRFWLTRDYLPEVAASLSVLPPSWPALSERGRSRCSSRGTVLTGSSRPTGAGPRRTWTRRSVEGSRCGPPSAPTPSGERCVALAMTSHLADGPNATTTFSISTRPNSVFACSSPEAAGLGHASTLAPLVCQGGDVAEQQLDGGIANAGQVARVGPHVLRPSGPHSGSVHAFLRALRHAGFEGAPLPVGIDQDGRERLVFIDGEVPVPPYPDWSQSDTALASIARLLRRLHDAAHGFDPQDLAWDDALADPAGGTLVCHNDVEPSNVVFRDGIALALLDFEFAAPGRPVYDLAQLARLCVPVEDDFDQARLGWRPADRPARLRLVADAYGLDRDGRAELLTAMDDAIARIEAAVRRSVDAGDANSVAMVQRTGGMEKYDRRRCWWRDHHAAFAAALL